MILPSLGTPIILKLFFSVASPAYICFEFINICFFEVQDMYLSMLSLNFSFFFLLEPFYWLTASQEQLVLSPSFEGKVYSEPVLSSKAPIIRFPDI